MVTERITVLDFLCKAGLEGDVGFLRKVVRRLAEALMALEAEHRVGGQPHLWESWLARPSPRPPPAPLAHPGGGDYPAHPRAEEGKLLPLFPERAAEPRRFFWR